MSRFTGFLIAAALILPPARTPATPWVSAYYAGWQQQYLPVQAIDFSAFTHLVHFAVGVKEDGDIEFTSSGLSADHSAAVVRAAHLAGKKVILCVGGANTARYFVGATSDKHRGAFIARLVRAVTSRHYDGLDVDWEPVAPEYFSRFGTFIRELKAALRNADPKLLLTAAAGQGAAKAYAPVADLLDQINLMTYDMSGAWGGWVVWHNAPLYNAGVTFPGTGAYVPSAHGVVTEFRLEGVPAAKLGIGIDFYGYVWSGGTGTSTGGVTQPGQQWSNTPAVKDNVPYHDIMDWYFSRERERWDNGAQAAYLQLDGEGDANDKFISFDNERTCKAKIDYARNKGLGGVIIWELGGAYRANLPPGYRDALLQSVKAAAAGRAYIGDTTRPRVSIRKPQGTSPVVKTVVIEVSASDDGGVRDVRVIVDGRETGIAATSAPYVCSLDTWRLTNGKHEIGVVARDMAGNEGKSTVTITVANQGPPPKIPDLWVYLNGLQQPFSNTSWGATVALDDKTISSAGSQSIRVDFSPNGALDLLYGTWGATHTIQPADYDTLRVDVFAGETTTLTAGFYTDYAPTFSLRGGQWNRVAIPLAGHRPFERFYFSMPKTTAFFDNIRFTGTEIRPHR